MQQSNKTSILLVEDEDEQRELIKTILINNNYQVKDASSGREAVELMNNNHFDVVISDWKLGDINGNEILEHLKSASPNTAFVLITAHSDPSHAIQMIRAGADDYLAKPFDKTTLLFTLNKLVYVKNIEVENALLKNQISNRSRLLNLIGQSAAMNRLYTRIEKAAPTNATVLITGESGTGKELAAHAIHLLSNRKQQIFLPINCAAIPENLAEAELFGAEKGSYTGAVQTRIGKLEAADNGTVFLDEIGELPLLLQSKLLRFLQEGKITRVGATKEISLNVRVLAATNRDLLAEVNQQRFREDLYYRLNVIPVKLPPLKNRQEDLFPLVQHFIKNCCLENNIELKQLSSSALKALLKYSWPGNVRQLRNTIERLVLLSPDSIISIQDIEELELFKNDELSQYVLPMQGINWERHEKDFLLQALSICNENRTQAAKLLGLNYKAFLYRLEKYNLN